MYNATTIKNNLLGLIGWRQNWDSSGTQLMSMTTTDSGLYYNDVHPLVTIENLESISKEFSRYTVAAWDISTTYEQGAFVSYSGNIYRCVSEIITELPTNTTYWRETNFFTEWLRDFTESAIVESVQDWITTKANLKTAGNLLERDTLFYSSGNMLNELQVNKGKTVGFEIIPKRSKSLQVKINSIALQFDTNQSITIRVKESGSINDFQSETLSYTGEGAQQWFTVDWTLDGSKSYWICYDEDAITGQSVNSIKDYGFHRQGIDTFPTGKYYKCTAFENDATLSASTIFDLSDNVYHLDSNYGLNLKLTSECDYTELITEQKQIFKTLIWKKIGIKVLQALAYNAEARINRNERNIDFNQIQFEINGDTQGKKQGLLNDYSNALNAISFDTTMIDKICLPCRKTGAKIGTVWG